MKKQKKKNLSKILVYFKDYKYIYILCFLIMLITDFGIVIYGGLIGDATQSLINKKVDNAVKLLVLYFIIVIVNNLLNRFREYLSRKSQIKISRKIGYDTYNKAMKLPAYAYEEMSSGEIINRITSDADTLSFAFGRLLNMISSLVASIIVIVYVFINSWIIGLEIVGIVSILFLILKKYNPLLKDIHKERRKEQDKFTSLTTESIRGIREIKTLGIKNNLISDMTSIIKNIYNKSSKEIDIQKSFNIKTRLLKSILECSVFATCVILLYYKMISLTFFIAMTYYVYRFTWLIENINDLTQTYQKVSVSISRVNDILENRLYKDEEFGNKKLVNVKGVIEFKDVNFNYPDEGNILNNFSLKIEPNKKIAVVGASGQGKSTLFNLITRIFDTTSGEILLDGINIKDLSEDELRKHISIIRQEPFVFNRTIKENFKLINKNISLKKIREYSKMAYLDDYIMSLPKGYDTVLGESGINLSGGQKQRLSIARTLSKGSEVILFDEATSALDNNSQDYIKKTIDNLVNDHTIVIVAHRLSTIMDADIIHVVDGGKVIATGTHKELLNSCKIYRNLYETESLNS